MPFTPSHAVVALPFIRTPLVPAAIAVGAMAPDLPLFVRFSPLGYGRTHDLAWLPATVLLALALLLAWRCVLRPAARELSPRWLAGRLPAEWDRGAAGSLRDTLGVRTVRAPGRPQRRSVSWRAVALLVVSLALGVVSHIAWDLFTHEGRGGVDLFPALAEQWGPLAGYKWLQHGSSVVGLAILAVSAVLWLRRRRVEASVPCLLPSWARWTWWLSLPVILTVAWVIGLAVYGPLDAEFTIQHLAYRVLPQACAVWGLVTVVLAVVVQIIVVAAVGLSAAVWPADAIASRVATSFGVIAGAGWIMAGVSGFAQRTALLNGTRRARADPAASAQSSRTLHRVHTADPVRVRGAPVARARGDRCARSGMRCLGRDRLPLVASVPRSLVPDQRSPVRTPRRAPRVRCAGTSLLRRARKASRMTEAAASASAEVSAPAAC